MTLSQEFLIVANEASSIFLIDLNTMKIASLQNVSAVMFYKLDY